MGHLFPFYFFILAFIITSTTALPISDDSAARSTGLDKTSSHDQILSDNLIGSSLAGLVSSRASRSLSLPTEGNSQQQLNQPVSPDSAGNLATSGSNVDQVASSGEGPPTDGSSATASRPQCAGKGKKTAKRSNGEDASILAGMYRPSDF